MESKFVRNYTDQLTTDIWQDEVDGAEYLIRLYNEDAGTRTSVIGITAKQALRVLMLLDELEGEDDE
jgi:hypothetical protein